MPIERNRPARSPWWLDGDHHAVTRRHSGASIPGPALAQDGHAQAVLYAPGEAPVDEAGGAELPAVRPPQPRVPQHGCEEGGCQVSDPHYIRILVTNPETLAYMNSHYERRGAGMIQMSAFADLIGAKR